MADKVKFGIVGFGRGCSFLLAAEFLQDILEITSFCELPETAKYCKEHFCKEGSKVPLAANCTYYRAIRAMRNCVQSGKYGEVVYGDAEYIHPPLSFNFKPVDYDNIHWRQTLPNCYYNMHDLGPMMFITNSVPVRTVGKGVVTGYKELKNCDKNFALVEMDNGAVINYSGCTGVGSMSKWFRPRVQ